MTPPLLLYMGQDAPVLAVNTACMGVTTPCCTKHLLENFFWILNHTTPSQVAVCLLSLPSQTFTEMSGPRDCVWPTRVRPGPDMLADCVRFRG